MKLALLLTLLAASALADVSVVDELRNKLYSLERRLWHNVADDAWTSSGLGDVELTKAFVAFDGQLESVPRPPRAPIKSWLWSKAVEKIQVIDGFYKNFVQFIRRQALPGAVPSPVREWLDVAEGVLMDPAGSVDSSVRKLGDLLAHGDMFRTTLQDNQAELCQLEVSPHQLIYDMYNTIALTEIKGYAMMQFSWMLLKLYGKGNYSQEALITRNKYHERTLRTAVAASAALRMARRDVYRCDPSHHIKGETYEEVTRLLQGYIENEVDLNEEGTCRDNCAYYTLATRHGCFDGNGICTKQTACNGRIINCQFIDSDMTVCPASRSSSRRYEFVVYENGRTLGKSAHDGCKLGPYQVDSWWRWLFWHCSNCMCLCDEPGPDSDRYFSLWDATSDVRNNKVVTGVRIVKHGQVFHLQVSEGSLGERGFVTPGEWVPVQKFDVYDPGMRDGVDYHTLTYEKRAIDLDELDSPAGRVLTGVRFRLIGAHLHFEIRSTPFNYTTGRLSPERSEWISNDNTDVGDMPRSKLELRHPDIPTRGSSNLRVDSQHDQYLEFTNSDLDADAAQSTVPFIDIQPLKPMKGAALLSGAGVVHRGAPQSGGFLALKVLSYDQSSHVRATPPPPDDDEPPLPQGDN